MSLLPFSAWVAKKVKMWYDFIIMIYDILKVSLFLQVLWTLSCKRVICYHNPSFHALSRLTSKNHHLWDKLFVQVRISKAKKQNKPPKPKFLKWSFGISSSSGCFRKPCGFTEWLTQTHWEWCTKYHDTEGNGGYQPQHLGTGETAIQDHVHGQSNVVHSGSKYEYTYPHVSAHKGMLG